MMKKKEHILLFFIVFVFLTKITQTDEQGFGRLGFGIGIGDRYNRYRGFARSGAGVHVGSSNRESDVPYSSYLYYKNKWRHTWPKDPERKYQEPYRIEGQTYRIDRMKVGSSTPGSVSSNRSGRSVE